MLTTLSNSFLEYSEKLTRSVVTANSEQLATLGKAIAESIAGDGVLHVFGSGHSAIIAREIVNRAGGLVPVSAVTDPTAGWSEVVAGYGTLLFQRYAWQYEPRKGEYLIVVSNSGINPVPIEVAQQAKESGLKVIALTSLTMSQAAKSRHPSGLRLFEVADCALDNLVESGDAAIDVPGTDYRTGPVSTVSGCLLMNLLVLEIIASLNSTGKTLPLLISANIPGGKEHNARISTHYKHRICRPL
jgi:uncharacterized phosphosugar-binding protein